MPDFGPIYAETVPGRFPVEPWNTYSNLIFLILVIYFSRHTKLDFRRYPLTSVCLPLLLVGFIGGTVFHATRSSHIWLTLDYMPIFIICLLAEYYFWRRAGLNPVQIATVIFISILALRLLWASQIFPSIFKMALSYSILAFSLVLPCLLCSRQKEWLGFRKLCAAVLCFTVAISFRSLDKTLLEYFPMGTHFLWHIFGGLSTFFMLSFAMNLERVFGRSKDEEA